ncbi:MAG: hypothetical protein LC797_00405 [Chloroflexi bacterium]|nr:hypothetical protein [Chloroflexota bacterium]
MDSGGPESVSGLLAPFGGLFERLEQVVTLDRAVRYCFALSDTPAPSGSARFTRAKALVSLLEQDGLLSGLTADVNYLGTGNLALATGVRPAKPVWLLAHLDQCSYLVDRREGTRYRLIPNCYHLIRAGSVPARALDLGADGEPHRVPPDQLPQLAIVVDSHEAEDMADGRGPSRLQPGGGACFGEAASRGRGGITQPRLYAFQRTLGAFLETRSVALRENADGYFSRSDCVPLMLATPNVGLLGYLLSHRHFDGQPRAHPADLVHLARSLAVYALVAQSADWRTAHLGSR